MLKSLLIHLNLCAQSYFQCIIKSTIRDFKVLLKRHFGAYKTQRYNRKLESSRITAVCILIFIGKKMVRSFRQMWRDDRAFTVNPVALGRLWIRTGSEGKHVIRILSVGIRWKYFRYRF